MKVGFQFFWLNGTDIQACWSDLRYSQIPFM